MHAARILRSEPVRAAVIALEADSRQSLLAEIRLHHPTIPRIALLTADEPYDAPTAAIAHFVRRLPIARARFRSLIERACGSDGVIPMPPAVERLRAPSISDSVQRLLEELDRPDASLIRIATLIERDPMLSANVLALANSAYFGMPRRVQHVREAANILGLVTLRLTVLGAGVFSSVPGGKADLEAVRGRSVLLMQVARWIGGPKAEECATAALLSDVGGLVLTASRLSGLDLNSRPPQEILLEEAESLGVDRGLVGAWWLARWQMPPSIVQAACFGLDPYPSPARGLDTVAAVYLADQLIRQAAGTGAGPEPAWLAALGLEGSLDSWRERLESASMRWPEA